MTNTNEAIREAQAPTNFDVLSFVEHTAYPTATVKVYTDAKGAADLLELHRQRSDNDLNGVEDAALDDRISTLIEQVSKSALTFNLRGMPPGVVREIYNVPADADEQASSEAEAQLIASTIVGVVNADNQADPRVWTAEDVTKLRRFLKEAEYGKLVQGVVDVNFNASVFDQATDAGFLGGGTDLGA